MSGLQLIGRTWRKNEIWRHSNRSCIGRESEQILGHFMLNWMGSVRERFCCRMQTCTARDTQRKPNPGCGGFWAERNVVELVNGRYCYGPMLGRTFFSTTTTIIGVFTNGSEQSLAKSQNHRCCWLKRAAGWSLPCRPTQATTAARVLDAVVST